MPTTPEILQLITKLCDEADRLLAQREGIHNMHGARGGLYTTKKMCENGHGDAVPWDIVDLLIRNMRWTVANGQYPKSHEVIKNPNITWQELANQ